MIILDFLPWLWYQNSFWQLSLVLSAFILTRERSTSSRNSMLYLRETFSMHDVFAIHLNWFLQEHVMTNQNPYAIDGEMLVWLWLQNIHWVKWANLSLNFFLWPRTHSLIMLFNDLGACQCSVMAMQLPLLTIQVWVSEKG